MELTEKQTSFIVSIFKGLNKEELEIVKGVFSKIDDNVQNALQDLEKE